jgi:hypothetical protein
MDSQRKNGRLDDDGVVGMVVNLAPQMTATAERLQSWLIGPWRRMRSELKKLWPLVGLADCSLEPPRGKIAGLDGPNDRAVSAASNGGGDHST